jgi:hypothetical protein
VIRAPSHVLLATLLRGKVLALGGRGMGRRAPSGQRVLAQAVELDHDRIVVQHEVATIAAAARERHLGREPVPDPTQ